MTMATTSSVSRSFPTLRYLAAPFRWFFRSRRRVLTVAVVLLAMIAVPPLWWSLQLVGLPDIGEPFDRRAFRSFAIPDDRNAYVLYRRAAALLKRIESAGDSPSRKMDLMARWSKADPLLHRWLEANGPAMAIYRQGTERGDALALDAPERTESDRIQSALLSFFLLALLEASRLEEQGDMAGAWVWYRAALRSSYHQGMRTSVMARRRAQDWNRLIRDRLISWAADSRTTPATLLAALSDSLACDAILPSDSYTIKAEYAELEEMVESPRNPGRVVHYVRWIGLFKPWPIRPTPEQTWEIAKAWRTWRREPERSIRVLRLVIANWLAYYDLPPARRPKPDPGVAGPYDFYAPAPEASASARALSPAALGRWLASTTDAEALLRTWGFRGVYLQDRANYRALVVLLASELYRRDHGGDPPSEEALVGPYLKELPDDGRSNGPDASRPPAGSPVQ
jgi:hypothetical protein